jgi:hypothetical protein
MWISVIGSILLAALSEESDEESRKKALGLSMGGQLDFPFGRQGDMLIPVKIWADGAGIWRVIGWEDMKEILAGLKGRTFFDKETLEESFKIDDWQEQQLTNLSGGYADAYVYLDEKAHGHRPSLLLLTGSDRSDGGTNQIDVVPLHGKRQDDKGLIRLQEFIEENGWPVEELPQIVEIGIVPDRMLEVRNQVLAGKQDVDITEELARSWDGANRRIGLWVSDYIELRDQFLNLEGLLQEKDDISYAGPDDEEAMNNFRDSSDEEEIARVDEELENFAESPTFERWKEYRISDIDEQIRDACNAIDRISKEEAAGLEIFLKNIELDRRSERRSVHEWRISAKGSSRYDEGIDTLMLEHDDEGRHSYDFDKASLKFSPKRPGAFEALYEAGYIETEGERKKKIGEVVWRFPGGLSGTWEVNHILDRFTPNGTEPLFVFIKIAADHGLLSPYAQKKYEKLLLLWGDENLEELLETHGIFKGSG